MDEQLAAEGITTECYNKTLGHLPLRARRIQQIPPVCLRRLSLSVETRSGAEERFSKHSSLHPKCANSKVAR